MFTLKRRLLAVTVLGILALAQAVPASAGSAGQQIRLWDYGTAGYAQYTGYNQYGSYGMHFAGDTPNYGSNWFNLWGYWWQGWVTIQAWSNDGSTYFGADSCAVPWSQPGNDWTNCYI